MLAKEHRMTRTRAVKSKKTYSVSIDYGSVYQDSNGEEYVSWRTVLKNLGDKIQKKEHIYFINAMKRGKIKSKEFFDTVFIPLHDPMATLNCSVILSFKVSGKKTKDSKKGVQGKKKEVHGKKKTKSVKPVVTEEEYINVEF